MVRKNVEEEGVAPERRAELRRACRLAKVRATKHASPAPAATAVPADIARLAVQISALASSDRAKAPEILPLQGSSDLLFS